MFSPNKKGVPKGNAMVVSLQPAGHGHNICTRTECHQAWRAAGKSPNHSWWIFQQATFWDTEGTCFGYTNSRDIPQSCISDPLKRCVHAGTIHIPEMYSLYVYVSVDPNVQKKGSNDGQYIYIYIYIYTYIYIYIYIHIYIYISLSLSLCKI